MTFQVDGEFAGTAAGPDARVVHPLTPGRHQLRVTATYDGGATATATSTFEVKPR
jgi:hypothetical protein